MLRTAVIGTGYLGTFHAHKYAQIPSSKLIGVADTNEHNGQKVARQCNTKFFSNHKALLGKVDAVSIAVPTSQHHQIARDFLHAGVHVLVEKPITVSVKQAQELVDIAKGKKLILQVGFLERFNAALGNIASLLKRPRFIESHRLAGFKPRSMDINVIMDLMIHDLDIVLNLVGTPLVNIAANGTPVLSNSIDIAQARLTFQCGCVANLTASRISHKSKRKIRIFQEDSCIYVDFKTLKTSYFFKGKQELYPGIPNIECQVESYVDDDKLKKEIEDFLKCVNQSSKPKVTGEDGQKALDVACQISEIIAGDR